MVILSFPPGDNRVGKLQVFTLQQTKYPIIILARLLVVELDRVYGLMEVLVQKPKAGRMCQ